MATPVSRSLTSLPTFNPVSLASAVISRAVRSAVLSFLSNGILRGSFTLVHPPTAATDEPDRVVVGETSAAAIAAGRPVAEILLVDADSFYARVASSADIGFAEAYIAGDFVVSDQEHLLAVFRVLILNRDSHSLDAGSLFFSRIGAWINTALHSLNSNSLAGSRRNIQAHYDLSNELFATFLGKSWTYSCALFDEESTPTALSLDSAQNAKLDLIISKARLSENCHLLEIGCGWGELAIRAAKQTGCKVTGITLSDEQLSLARERIDAAGVAHLVDFQLIDYRDLPSLGKRYDRIVSIEMLEAVGHAFLGNFFSVLDSVLAPGGLAVIQVITTPEERYAEYRTSADFIQKHIFPGGLCPSIQAVVSAASKDGKLSLEHAQNIGPHYATTLREWRRRFTLSEKRGDVAAAGFDKFFVRKWIYYFLYCEAGFASRTLGTMQLVFTHAGNVEALGGPPECREDFDL